MRAALAAIALLLACGSLQAQRVFEKAEPPPAKEQKKGKAATKAEKGRPAQERQTSQGPVKMDRVRPEAQRPATSPSPAQQMQQQQYEQRQQQQSRPRSDPQSRVVQCNARPVCGGSGYGRCAPVAQTYQGATLQAGRREIIQACIAANTPDSCSCAAQCSSVARCSIF